ncbi:DUF2812 domain-containing protein [Ammoniphilus sp. CFH 90114]|uniref:DUF2812 domain-containing protein n=1 Tax=Ammoniphilus sp. CFH 90114 TaxID=2493665 RepID=UPI00100FD4A4|nr:DUF2812 domain-containing protein [Ammoniphilus sp. CFH 90114]RXT01950.1 DUF2812 domain-containing protein [Ammoniphilus sp. CFH 90114]
MKNKEKKRLIMFNLWEIEEQMSWFTDMSLQGWRLTRLNHGFATFEPCEPEEIIYRCEFSHQKSNAKTGWEFVGSRNIIHVYRRIPGEQSIEIHADPIKQAEGLSILKRSIFTRGLLTLLLTILLVGLTMAKLKIDPVGNYLQDTFIESFVFLIAYFFISFTMVKGMIHTSKLMRKLKSGTLLEHNTNFKRKMYQNQWIAGSVILMMSLWMINIVTNLLTVPNDPFPPIPKGELPVVQLSDFMDTPLGNQGKVGEPFHYFREDSSLLVPKQYELNQEATVHATYKPAIRSYLYEVRSTWLAEKFLKALKVKNTSYNENYESIQDSAFDELWISKEEYKSAFIARFNNQVYYVVYFGKEPIEALIDEALAKAKG